MAAAEDACIQEAVNAVLDLVQGALSLVVLAIRSVGLQELHSRCAKLMPRHLITEHAHELECVDDVCRSERAVPLCKGCGDDVQIAGLVHVLAVAVDHAIQLLVLVNHGLHASSDVFIQVFTQ